MNIDISYNNAPGHIDSLLYTIKIVDFPCLYGSTEMRNHIGYGDMWNYSTKKIGVDFFTTYEIDWSCIPDYNNYKDALVQKYPHHTDNRIHITWPHAKHGWQYGETFPPMCREVIIPMGKLLGERTGSELARKEEAESILYALHDKIMVHYCLMTMAADTLKYHDIVEEPEEALV